MGACRVLEMAGCCMEQTACRQCGDRANRDKSRNQKKMTAGIEATDLSQDSGHHRPALEFLMGVPSMTNGL